MSVGLGLALTLLLAFFVPRLNLNLVLAVSAASLVKVAGMSLLIAGLAAIARALVNDPALILADEPTANLDSKIGHEIMRLLRRIAKEQNRSVIIVSHDQRIKDIADRVLWLENGRFKEMVTMATDPVCGMAIEREQAAASLIVDGETYYFCSRSCRAEFEGRVL
jgi:ABC-type multidrug transport system fused ATPase/permease subunit/YHS domain-containing protein